MNTGNAAKLRLISQVAHISAEDAYTIEKTMTDCRNNCYEGVRFATRSWYKVHKACLRWLKSALEASSAEQLGRK